MAKREEQPEEKEEEATRRSSSPFRRRARVSIEGCQRVTRSRFSRDFYDVTRDTERGSRVPAYTSPVRTVLFCFIFLLPPDPGSRFRECTRQIFVGAEAGSSRSAFIDLSPGGAHSLRVYSSREIFGRTIARFADRFARSSSHQVSRSRGRPYIRSVSLASRSRFPPFYRESQRNSRNVQTYLLYSAFRGVCPFLSFPFVSFRLRERRARKEKDREAKIACGEERRARGENAARVLNRENRLDRSTRLDV